MKIIADTNVLLRTILPDDGQRGVALAELVAADSVAVSVHVLCELVWVLSRRYGSSRSDIAEAIKRVVDTAHVSVDHQAVSAGMTMLGAGGDFADGVIAHEGRCLGGQTIVSFDKKAVRLVEALGYPSRLLA